MRSDFRVNPIQGPYEACLKDIRNLETTDPRGISTRYLTSPIECKVTSGERRVTLDQQC
jgi:hypothetical protein